MDEERVQSKIRHEILWKVVIWTECRVNVSKEQKLEDREERRDLGHNIKP